MTSRSWVSALLLTSLTNCDSFRALFILILCFSKHLSLKAFYLNISKSSFEQETSISNATIMPNFYTTLHKRIGRCDCTYLCEWIVRNDCTYSFPERRMKKILLKITIFCRRSLSDKKSRANIMVIILYLLAMTNYFLNHYYYDFVKKVIFYFSMWKFLTNRAPTHGGDVG